MIACTGLACPFLGNEEDVTNVEVSGLTFSAGATYAGVYLISDDETAQIEQITFSDCHFKV
jgi:hypothetical protein